jgi:DNA polymerase-3 subunit beta
VATDGHRLAMITRKVEHLALPGALTIPRKAVMELRKVLESGEDLVELTVQGGVAHASRGRVQMSMRLVEGEFPDYNQVIPKKSERHASIDATALHAALRRVQVVSSERTRGVRLQLDGQKLELSTINPDVGEASRGDRNRVRRRTGRGGIQRPLSDRCPDRPALGQAHRAGPQRRGQPRRFAVG